MPLMTGYMFDEAWFKAKQFNNARENLARTKGKLNNIRMYMDVLATSTLKRQRMDAISKTKTLLQGIQESWDYINQELLKNG